MTNDKLKRLFKKVLFFLIITIVLWFFKLSMVNAAVITPFNELEQIKYTNINSIRIYSNAQTLYPASNYAVSSEGESLALKSYLLINTLNLENANNLIGQPLLVTVNLCSMERFDGSTNSDNITGDFEFVRSFPTQSTGKCRVKGTNYNANGYIMRMVITPKSYHNDTGASVPIISGNFTFWGGGYALGGGYFSSSGFSVVLFTPELENQISQSIQNNTIINQNDTIINNQNQINSNLTDETSPNLNGLENSAGWLKPGPVDSILNLPLSLLNNLTSNLSKSCSPIDLPLPFVNKNLQLPCLNSIYNKINGVGVFLNSIGVVASAFIIYEYLRKLYIRIDKILNFDNSNDWGDI